MKTQLENNTLTAQELASGIRHINVVRATQSKNCL